MAHSSGGRLDGRPVGGWTSHRKNAPFLYFHTTRDTTRAERQTARRDRRRWSHRFEDEDRRLHRRVRAAVTQPLGAWYAHAIHGLAFSATILESKGPP